MGTLSLHSGPLLTRSKARERGFSLLVACPGSFQLQWNGGAAKLGCAGWEVFQAKSRLWWSAKGGPARPSASIGFTADPRVKIERSANGLLKDAAMLFVYQDVLKAPPAQAFLTVLLALRRGDDALKVLESYGQFFKLMAISRSPSWEDFLLDGILVGDNNPFAEAASNAGNTKSLWTGGVPPALQAAAASDLDVLQRLNISESTLSGWVSAIVSDVRPEWKSAAAATLSSRGVVKAPSSATETSRPFGFSVCEDVEHADEERKDMRTDAVATTDSKNLKGSAVAPQRDFLSIDRERWRKKIGGLWKWSQAVPMLEEYYAQHGVGRIVSTQALVWKGGKLMRDLKHLSRPHPCELSVQAEQRDDLVKNLRKHAKGSSAQHVVLCGPSGSGKSWLLSYALNKVSHEDGLRIVSLPNSEIKSLGQVLEDLGRQWNARFALTVDDIFARGSDESFWLLKTALDGAFHEWPDNVLLCATALKSEHQPSRPAELDEEKRAADLQSLFGMILQLKELELDEYVTTTTEIFKHRTEALHSTSKTIDEVEREATLDYHITRGRFSHSIRYSAQFVKTLL